MTDSWWDGVAPVETTVACGGGEHRLRWEDGRLTTPAHPDPAGERLLAALGGQEPACVAMVEAWDLHSDDLRVLAVASRSATDVVTVTSEDIAAVSNSSRAQHLLQRLSQMHQNQFPGRWPPNAIDDIDKQLEQHRRRLALLSVLALPAPFQQRLQLTVTAHWAGRHSSGDPGVEQQLPRLEAAVVGRAMPVLRTWLGRSVPVDVSLGLPGEPPSVIVNQGGAVARFGLDWLANVWGREMALVGGQVVLEVHHAGRTRVTVTALGTNGRSRRLALQGPAPWRPA